MSLTNLQIITRGMRLIGAIGTGDEPTADEADAALISLNGLVRGLFGSAIGPRLTNATAATSLTAQSGRVYMAGTVAVTITLPTDPRPGARVGVADVGTMASNNCTIARGGSLLEAGTSNIVLSTTGSTRQWFFRPDTGNWVREADLLLTDSPFFPDILIEYMPFMLAAKLSSEFADQNLTESTARNSVLGYQRFQDTYGRHGRHQQNPGMGSTVPNAPVAV